MHLISFNMETNLFGKRCCRQNTTWTKCMFFLLRYFKGVDAYKDVRTLKEREYTNHCHKCSEYKLQYLSANIHI